LIKEKEKALMNTRFSDVSTSNIFSLKCINYLLHNLWMQKWKSTTVDWLEVF